MKTLKIIIGFLLLFGAGKEYVAASTELGSLFSPGILVGMLFILLISTWLIGSGFSAGMLKFKSLEFLKFFAVSVAIFVIVAFFSLGGKAAPGNFVEINGLKVPLRKCIDGNRRIIPDPIKAEAYCKCFVEKVTNDSELKTKFRQQLENDRMSEVFEALQTDTLFLKLSIEDCLPAQWVEWTENLANTLKNKWKKELAGTEFEKTNDLDRYCDCLVGEYQKHPLDKIMEAGFGESEEAVRMNKICEEESRK